MFAGFSTHSFEDLTYVSVSLEIDLRLIFLFDLFLRSIDAMLIRMMNLSGKYVN